MSSIRKETLLYSVIIPVYNRPEKILRSASSVISQTYRNFELIIINDGSNDKTKEIIDELCTKDKRIKVKHLDKNEGVIAARNEGIKLSEGDIICYLDSDDIWYNEMLEKINYYYLKGEKAVSTGFKIVDEKSNKLKNIVKYQNTLVNWRNLLNQNKANCLTGSHLNIFKNQIYFKNFLREDFVYWLDIGMRINIRCIPDVLAEYRTHKGSRSSSKFAMLFFQWYVYRRYLNFNFLISLYHIIIWIYKGIKRYYR